VETHVLRHWQRNASSEIADVGDVALNTRRVTDVPPENWEPPLVVVDAAREADVGTWQAVVVVAVVVVVVAVLVVVVVVAGVEVVVVVAGAGSTVQLSVNSGSTVSSSSSPRLRRPLQ
jgi:hypothetical protein